MDFSIIDPPVTPYSDPDKIRAWIRALESMPDSEAKEHELALAPGWLSFTDTTDSEGHQG